MSTVVNIFDVTLQAAAARSVNLPTADIQLLPSAPLFKVAPDGSITPPAITFTATLIDLDAPLTFNATGAPLTEQTAKSVTVVGESMTGSSVTVIASATVNGRTYTKPCTITKVQDGSVGSTTYTWIKYADSAAGAGLSDNPTGKAYIGLAYNKSSPIESAIASDYTWSLIKGEDGVPGQPGKDGVQLFTWIKYSNSADGAGLYDQPTADTLYIGIAVNKTTATESSNPTDYVWSRFKGDQGVPGPALYTWIKYADSAAGAGLSDDPTNKTYIGLAYNKTTAVESDNPADYTWSLNQGGQGVPGQPGKDGTTYYTWIKYSDVPDGTGLYDAPTASTMYIGIAVNKVTATESTNKADYTWSKFRGDQGVPGNPGQPGQRGTVDISAGTAGTVWTDSEATAAIAQTGYGTPQMLDVVTLYNQAAGFANTRYWSGSAWIAVSQVINGSLLVKNTVAADKIDTRGLSIKDAAGNVILAAGSALSKDYAAPGTLNSAVSLDSTGRLQGAGGGQVQTLPVVGGARGVNYAPRDYGIVHVKEFKECNAIGLAADISTYCTLETIKQWSDGSGGYAIQWAYVGDQTYKRSAPCDAAGWGAWIRDMDRSYYTGELDATKGANANNLNVGIGRTNLFEKNSLPSDTSSFAPNYNGNTGTFAYAGPGSDPNGYGVYSPGGRGCVFMAVNSRPAAGSVSDLYRTDRVKIVPGQRYEFGVTLSTHRTAARIAVAWYDVNGSYITEHGGNDVTNSFWSNNSASAPTRSSIVVTPPDGARTAMVFVRMSHTGEDSPYVFISQWYAGEALPSQVVPSPFCPSALEAYDAAKVAVAGLADKISSTASNILRAPIAITTGGGVVVGNMTYDATSGQRGSGQGVAITPYGIIAHNGSKYTLALDARDGNAYFGGEMQAAYGTFGSLRIANGGYIATGIYSGTESGWPGVSGSGFKLNAGGLMFGSPAGGQYFQITGQGSIYSPGLTFENGQLTLTNPIIVTPKISTGFSASIAGGGIVSSGANGTRSLGGRQIVPTNGAGPFTYSWVFSGDLAPSGSSGVQGIKVTGDGTDTVSFSGTGTNVSLRLRVTGYITDSAGFNAVASFTINATFGTPS